MMKRAVITGCTGVVGISLINELLQTGWKVFAVPRFGSKRISKIPRNDNLQIIECDLENIGMLPEMIKDVCDVFYHLAWDGTYGEARMDCFRQYHNVEYTLKAVYTAKRLGCSVFVGAGSQSECGHVFPSPPHKVGMVIRQSTVTTLPA